MSAARDEILSSIRRSLKRTGPLEETLQRALDARLAHPEVHIQPTVEGDLAGRFIAKLEAVAGTATRVKDVKQVAAAVTDYLAVPSLPPKVVMGTQPLFTEIEWPESLSIDRRAAQRDDQVAVTGAFAAVAETGPLVLLSGPESPTTLNFLPDVHIVVLLRAQIVTRIEDVWARLRSEVGAMPRTVNLITGPSRTADIEQTMQLGAHGPRSLHVILVES
ncbi:MAG: lactate utilization protein C [Acidiferrobacterales bacterium]